MPHAGHGCTQSKPGYVKNQCGSMYIASIQLLASKRTQLANITRPKMMRNAASDAISTWRVALVRIRSNITRLTLLEAGSRATYFAAAAEPALAVWIAAIASAASFSAHRYSFARLSAGSARR